MKKFIAAFIVGFGLIIASVGMQQNTLYNLKLYNAKVTVFYPSWQVEYDYNDNFKVGKDNYAIRIDVVGVSQYEYIKDKLHLKTIKTESLDNINIKYEYSYLLPKCEYIGLNKYNLMIVFKLNQLIIGYPVIVGSY